MKLHCLFVSALVLLGCSNQNGLGYDGSGAGGYGATGANGALGAGGYGAGGNAGFGAGQAGGTAAQAGNVAYLSETIGDTILFPVDQSYLTEEAKLILNQQAEWLNASSSNILIEGHADEQGTREYNLALGARRAAAVRDYLVTRGVAYGRVEVITYGKERPLAVCSEESCWAKNRRAVTVVR